MLSEEFIIADSNGKYKDFKSWRGYNTYTVKCKLIHIIYLLINDSMITIICKL